MIFRPELVELIINQRKTETRRKVKPGQVCRYEPGKHYAVQPGRGEKAVDRILIHSVHKETVGELDHQAALREGFENIGDFIGYWEALYEQEMDFDQPVWVISFELYRPAKKTQPPRDVVRVLRGPWDPGVAPAVGVAERRRAPELEPVRTDIEERFAEQNWTRFAASRGDEHARRELNRLGRTVREEGLRAIRAGRDVSAQLTNIQRELDAIRERNAA